jgi:hypothetical protein
MGHLEEVIRGTRYAEQSSVCTAWSYRHLSGTFEGKAIQLHPLAAAFNADFAATRWRFTLPLSLGAWNAARS